MGVVGSGPGFSLFDFRAPGKFRGIDLFLSPQAR